MTQYALSEFIHDNIESILQAWEDFARTIEPPALTMDDTELRDHARQMLQAFAKDLATPQSAHERDAKAKGLGKRGPDDTAAETHAEARLLSGYTVVQLVSEYRALRSSVLTLWTADIGITKASHMVDVTRFNEAVDQALAESVARYEFMVNQSQNMFLAILGHDLRNPLGTVVTGSSFLMQAVDIPPKYVLVATRMFNSAKRMSKLINDLIDFTRTHLGPGIPIRVKQGNLVAVCAEVTDEMRTYHPERQIELDIPPRLDAIFDESRLAQVLSNLIGNAIQYSAPDVPVTVRVEDRGDSVSIAVNNQGSPIAADKIVSVFDPMVRIAANVGANGADGGYIERTSLGIGLYISREIVHAHGGQIVVASNARDGTTFTVIMPLVPVGFRSAQDAANAPDASAA
ncbi:sensor histidine kinase [Massilia sp. Dwa41.01b]|uniref:sensor histidine kinase n=1 Tax=unclassified Massilia TaxID=2609279 RepID=UPI0015FF7543|nr:MULTISPECIES: sensor histidine kinase [unclassified Massilia]QNA90226.1 sensor histidine kinase [Massilia sp. Dwa41.01b]QNB01113.1 sensor histidine kinase [Massilia sp. Se16.2.3]